MSSFGADFVTTEILPWLKDSSCLFGDRMTSQEGKPMTSQEGKPLTSLEGKPQTSLDGRPMTSQEGTPMTSQEGRLITSQEGRLMTSQEGRLITSQEGRPLTSQEGRPLTSLEGQQQTIRLEHGGVKSVHQRFPHELLKDQSSRSEVKGQRSEFKGQRSEFKGQRPDQHRFNPTSNGSESKSGLNAKEGSTDPTLTAKGQSSKVEGQLEEDFSRGTRICFKTKATSKSNNLFRMTVETSVTATEFYSDDFEVNSSSSKETENEFVFSPMFQIRDNARKILVNFTFLDGSCKRVQLGEDRLNLCEGHLIVYTVDEKRWKKSTFIYNTLSELGF
jgi:hypothetical protein